MSELNLSIRLKQRPQGLPKDDTWEQIEEAIPDIAEGQVLLKVLFLSIDPAMRGWINEGKSYIEPVAVGEVMRAGAVSKVIQSKHEKFAVGDYVVGMQGVQQYAVSDGKGLQKVEPTLAPLPRYLGVLGMPGMTAYFGLLNTGQPKAGETVLVSGAAGAVGGVVGQIAKIKGCRVVGIAGGADKCQFLTETLGFDAAIDYKQGDLKSAIKRSCPDGVDVFFDNVGGETLDAALTQINLHARIVICGAISQYNNTTPIKGPSNYLSLLVNRAKMEGIVVFDNAKHYGAAALELAKWIQEGKLQAKEHVVQGLENFPKVLNMLFSGENFGKLVLQVAEDN